MFRKAVSVAGSLALLGSTVGIAAAVAYPAPFNAGNSAVVYGADAAESDMVAATTIQSDINAALVSDGSGSTTVEGGESYKLEKTNEALNHGEALQTNVLSDGKLDKDEFPDLLADGIFEGVSDTEYDYNQKIYLANEQTELIVNNDLDDREPTLGIMYADEGNVLTYNLTFEDALNMSDLASKDMSILGKDYYVLSSDADTITLLDTASSVVIQEGDSATVVVGGVSYDVSASIYSDGAVFTVNGVTSDQLTDGGYDKLTELSTGDDDVYVVAKDVRYSSKDTGISEVEFSIGAGKIVLDSGKTVQLNNNNVDGLSANISTGLVSLTWAADDDQFLTGDSGELTIPLFGAVKLVYGGINFPETTESTELISSENYITLDTEIKDGSLSLPIIYRSSTSANFTGTGEDANNLFTANSTGGSSSFNLTLVEDQDTSFVVTYIKNDEGYSYAFKVSSVDATSDDEPTLELDNLVPGGEDFTGSNKIEGLNEDIDLGDITITFVANDTTENATITVSTSVSGGLVYSDRLVTAEGLQVMLPVYNFVDVANVSANVSAADACASQGATATIDAVKYNDSTTKAYATTYCDATWSMNISEENKDNDVAQGSAFQATISSGDADGVHVSDSSLTERELQSNDDMYVAYMESQLASKVEMDKSGDTNTFVVKYNGEEVTVDLTVASADATVSSSESGVAIVKDSASVSGKNVVVVGGSAINAIAAELIGDVRGPAFTEATGVAAGEFLIETFDYNGALAMVVAGYDAADTTKAATYVANTDDEITVEAGMKYTGSSATEATLVTA